MCSLRDFLSTLARRVFSVSFERSQWNEIAGGCAVIFVRRFTFRRQRRLQSSQRVSDAMEKPLESWCFYFAAVSGGGTWHNIHQPVWTQRSQCQERYSHRLPTRLAHFTRFWENLLHFLFIHRSVRRQVRLGRHADDNEFCCSSTNVRKSYQLHPVAP